MCHCDLQPDDALGDVKECPCRENYAGLNCDECADGHHSLTAGCPDCECKDAVGAVDNNCTKANGACVCKNNFAGTKCDVCSKGYYDYPKCDCRCCSLSALFPSLRL